MKTITTEFSTYRIDEDAKLITRISGQYPPTHRFAPDGDWKPYATIQELAGEYGPRLLVTWPGGLKATFTSAVITTTETELLEAANHA